VAIALPFGHGQDEAYAVAAPAAPAAPIVVQPILLPGEIISSPPAQQQQPQHQQANSQQQAAEAAMRQEALARSCMEK
jgi:hypothetical protein